VPASRVQWLDRHLTRICTLSELTPTEFRNAEEKIPGVGRWLAAPAVYSRFLIRRLSPGIDADRYHVAALRTERVRSRSRLSASLVRTSAAIDDLRLVHGRMAANETYKAILEKLKRVPETELCQLVPPGHPARVPE